MTVPEALDSLVRQRMLGDEARNREALIAIIGEEKYKFLVNMVIADNTSAECKMEYRTTEHFQMTASSLRDVGDFLRHMFAEGFPPDTPLTETVTFFVDYTRDGKGQ